MECCFSDGRNGSFRNFEGKAEEKQKGPKSCAKLTKLPLANTNFLIDITGKH